LQSLRNPVYKQLLWLVMDMTEATRSSLWWMTKALGPLFLMF
jgi:hypothetical protein